MLDGADAKTLRETMDKLKDRLKSAAIVLGAVNDGKWLDRRRNGRPHRETQGRRAGQLCGAAGGRQGRGRPDMAQAGGTEPAKLPVALQSVKSGWSNGYETLSLCRSVPREFISFQPWHTMVGASTTPRRSSSSPARSSSRDTSTRTGTCASRCRARLGSRAGSAFAHGTPRTGKDALKPGVTATVVGYPNRNKPKRCAPSASSSTGRP